MTRVATAPRRRVDTAEAQLRRILLLVPRLEPFVPRTVGELARETGSSVEQLLADVARIRDGVEDIAGRIPPLALDVEGEGADATITLQSVHFLRPMRLTVPELRALELGLAMLAGERHEGERAAIAAARQRLRSILTRRPDGREAELPLDGVVAQLDAPARATLAALRAARRARRAVRVAYRAGEATAAGERVVHPYALVTAPGHWYCLAWCTRAEALRNFRLDRIEAVAATEASYAIPEDFSPLALLGEAGGAFVAGGTVPSCTIRYSPRIARWIAEREGAPCEADGSLTLVWPLADTDWAVRHVLQYGGEAEAVGPPALRAAVAARLDALLAGE
jgi:proteasome accessory factor C